MGSADDEGEVMGALPALDMPAVEDLLDTAPLPGPAGSHRPQSLLLSFLGALVLDRDLPPLPSMVLLDLLADLGVAEAAGRATLKRMTQRGLFTRGQVGRTAEYALTP